MSGKVQPDQPDKRVCARNGCRKQAKKRGLYCSDQCRDAENKARAKARKKAKREALGIPTPADRRAQDRARKKAAFLEAFARLGIVRLACMEAGIRNRQVPYEWAEADPDFARAWGYARDDANDVLEAEARRRGYDGIVKPLIAGGRLVKLNEITGRPEDIGQIATVREYSDKLLEKCLEANNPKFRRTLKTEVSGPGGGPIQFEDLSDADEQDLIREANRILPLASSDPAGG